MNRKVFFKWTMLIFNALLIVLAIHIGINFRSVRFYLRSKRASVFKERLGWRAHKQDNVNQLGFRGKKFNYTDNDVVVLLLGDSQVEAYTYTTNLLPEVHLQNSLKNKVKVYSLGAGGYGPDQELIALQEYYQSGYRADIVVFWFTPQNDIWNVLFPTHEANGDAPKPTYTIKNNKLNGPKYFRDYAVFEKDLPPSYDLIPYDANKTYDGIIRDHPVYGFDNFITERCHTQVYLDPESDRCKYGCKLVNMLIKEIRSETKKHNSSFYCFWNDPISSWQYFYPNYCSEGEYLMAPLKASVKFTRAAFDRNVGRCLSGIDNTGIKIKTQNPYYKPEDRHLNTKANIEVMDSIAKMIAKEVEKLNKKPLNK